MTLPGLIDKQDSVEIVRDKIAQILADEVAAQQVLAAAAGEDPLQWKLDVSLERTHPLEKWLNQSAERSPIVIVWFDAEQFPMDKGNVVTGQQAVGMFNIDCYGFGINRSDGAGGQTVSDKEAAIEAMRAARLVRNILMSAQYTYLDLRGTVARRWTQSITSFQPPEGTPTVQTLQGVRVSLEVEYVETAQQVPGEFLGCIHIDLKRDTDSFILAQMEYGDGCVEEVACDCTATHLDDSFWTSSKAAWDGEKWFTPEPQTSWFLEAINGWNTSEFRPSQLRVCMYPQPDAGNVFPTSVDVELLDSSIEIVGVNFAVFEGAGPENLQTVVVDLDWTSAAPGATIYGISFDADVYMDGPTVTCIEFVT